MWMIMMIANIKVHCTVTYVHVESLKARKRILFDKLALTSMNNNVCCC
jgi:hypothetical protein